MVSAPRGSMGNEGAPQLSKVLANRVLRCIENLYVDAIWGRYSLAHHLPHFCGEEGFIRTDALVNLKFTNQSIGNLMNLHKQLCGKIMLW